ncbi:hypothetical protein DFR52_10529 [Hoeflea marina]|uniref:Uncharacterized protein n=1 Tax=Hoeflea marina TaxID=274592 RepID=A0A317PFY7_9HYPH|nr:DUF6522 family protein [Hoeflea marina]PWV98052.1 hypothetical protein DFR52_10529 [Hoeflea marina]
MNQIRFEDGGFEIDAGLIAEGLGINEAGLQAGMHDGSITSLTEKGVGDDDGRYRLTFFSPSRRFRLLVDGSGTVLQRSTIDFGDRPLPASARRPGG